MLKEGIDRVCGSADRRYQAPRVLWVVIMGVDKVG